MTEAPPYPRQKITAELRAEMQRVYDAQGREAVLALFRARVGDDPWFRQPGSHAPIPGVDRLDWEFSSLMTGEGECD